jgi:GMP synthase-like glutamine amidotransferase
MRPVLLVRNDEYESFGVAPGALAWAGCDIVTIDMTRPGATLPDPEDLAAVITFGGTANVDQTDRYPYLAQVRAFTREAVERHVPYLGICLGSQLLARAMDRPVVRSPVKEVGFEPIHPTEDAADDPLLSLYADGDMVFQWHEDTYELPEGATLLASGDRIPVQAYRVGETAWGIQFHQELDAVELGWWIEIADREVDLRATWGKSAEELRSEAARHMAAHERRGRELFGRFAEVVGERRG